ncbi:hypothetical protein [Streptomyces sp. NBC_00454]|uniref:hypothetical protein n=1 Tax=Streptomyces sp. NBC_00454 TaxID=2975747 RepID=UPI0030DEC1BC
MALSAKWEEIFGADPGPVPAQGGGARMTLASAAAAGDGGGPGIQFSKQPWTSASGVAAQLRTSSNEAIADLGHDGKEGSGGATGFDATAALAEIGGSWKDRLTSVRGECDRLSEALHTVGKSFGETDDQVGANLKAATPQPSPSPRAR